MEVQVLNREASRSQTPAGSDLEPSNLSQPDLKLTFMMALFVAVSTLAASRLVLLDSIRSVDEALFHRVVPWLQQSHALVSTSTWLTDMGSKTFAYGIAVGVALALATFGRSLRQALLIVVTLVAIHGLQWVIFAATDGSTPTQYVLGTAGPFYSGGIVRAMVVAGMLARTAETCVDASRRGGRLIWGAALTVALVEGFTRLVLGRHWPLDVVAAVPIGAGVLWCYLRLSRWLAAM